jgi:hypothetical protein
LSGIIVEILDIATSHADKIDVRFNVGIESRLAFWQIQLLDKAVFRKDLKRFVDCRETDGRMNLLDFVVDSLCGGMISTLECKSADRYSLWSGFISVLSENFDYR